MSNYKQPKKFNLNENHQWWCGFDFHKVSGTVTYDLGDETYSLDFTHICYNKDSIIVRGDEGRFVMINSRHIYDIEFDDIIKLEYDA